MSARGDVRDVGARRAASDLLGRVRHLDLVDVVPEGAEVHVVVRSIGDEVTINGVVRLPGRRSDASGAAIGPGVHVEVRRRCITYRRVLAAEGGHGVVQVVRASDLDDIWSPEIGFARLVDLGTVGDCGAFVCPGSRNGGCAVDCDFAAGREAEVCPVVAADERWVVGVGAYAAAGKGVGIGIDGRGPKRK